jgi:hypothetical protein
MDRSPDADADPLTIARDAAHHMLDELAWMSLTASGIGAVVGSAVALTGWMMSPVIPLGVPGTLVVTGLVELALAPRTLSDSRRVGQVGALIWLAHCLILMVLSPPLIAFTLTSIGLLVGTIIGTTSAPPGAWRWGPIATTFWLGGLAAYLHLHAVDFANIPPLVAFPSLFLCGTAALVAGFTRRLHLRPRGPAWASRSARRWPRHWGAAWRCTPSSARAPSSRCSSPSAPSPRGRKWNVRRSDREPRLASY